MPESKAAAKAEKHYRRVGEGLTGAFKDAKDDRIDLGTQRLIIFSDHHRGARDGADDFWRCERAYHAALGYYLESGYRLILLGDVDELWENEPEVVIDNYERTLRLESEFRDHGGLLRFWGNHDDLWRNQEEVAKHLRRTLRDVPVLEALRLHVTIGDKQLGMLFLVHGHQGTLDSDRWSWFSRIPVRYIWRPLQRRWKFASTTPARDFKLRATHDAAMFDWAKNHEAALVLIAGHTHRPVFSTRKTPTERTVNEVSRDLDELRAADAERNAIADRRAELEFLKASPYDEEPKEMPLPCYFNTGCCSFGDGDVTGIEVDNRSFTLVRWLNDKYEPKRQVLDKRPVTEVFEAVRDSRTRAGDLGPRVLAAATE